MLFALDLFFFEYISVDILEMPFFISIRFLFLGQGPEDLS